MTDEQVVHNGTIIEHGRESPYIYKWRCSCGARGRQWWKKRHEAEIRFAIHKEARESDAAR